MDGCDIFFSQNINPISNSKANNVRRVMTGNGSLATALEICLLTALGGNEIRSPEHQILQIDYSASNHWILGFFIGLRLDIFG